MSHYKSNLRDIEFNLFEVFGRQEILGAGRRSGRTGPRAGRSPPPNASKLPAARAFGRRSGRSGENGGADDTPPGCRGGMPSLGCRMGMPAEGSRASVTSRKPNAKGSFVPQKC